MSTLFDAETDAYTATNGMHVGTALTVTWWCKLHAVSGSGNSSIWTLNRAGPPWIRTMTTSQDLQIFDGNNYSGAGFGSITMTLNSWYQCALVINGAVATFYRALDGASLTSVQVTNFESQSGPTQLAIGRDVDANGNWWNGSIANFKYWEAALTEAEVTSELTNWTVSRVANLIRAHKFQVPETADYSGNGNTLTAGSTSATVDTDPSTISGGGYNPPTDIPANILIDPASVGHPIVAVTPFGR